MASQALIEAMLGKQAPGVVGEEENFRQMQGRDPANAAQIGLMGSGQHIPAPYENAKLLLSMLPVTGNVMAARDAYDNAGQVVAASKAGDVRGQRKAAAMTGLSLLGAMSPLPWSGAARRAAEGASSRTNIFAGPNAKNANHVARMRAEEMEAQGIPRDEIWQATGWGKGVDGKWRWEIDDSGAALSRGTSQALSQGKRVDARLSDAFDHPGLYDAYAPGGMRMVADKSKGSSSGYSVPGLVYMATPNANAARSVTLHELQHQLQRAEGFVGGGQPKTFARELPGGGYDNGYSTYKRLAGEVEARNVQARRDMTAAERRAKAPWLTQDVPDEQQIVRLTRK